ncbi:MAG TPA: glycosyl hydrolase, partial [Anaerolineae bacterium]|nr:glycosyl hydrolase [Anaerolineae bacterium]
TVFVGLDVGAYKSTDGGLTWRAANAGLPSREDGTPAAVVALALSPRFAADGTLFAALAEGGVYKSTDGGQSWHPSGGD